MGRSRSGALDGSRATAAGAAPRAAAPRLVSVQLARGLAALAVALWHLPWVAVAFPGAVARAPGFLAFGYAGVDLFFVISGFILCHISEGRPFVPVEFARRRAVRILPLYALFTGAALLAVALNPAWDGKGVLSVGYVLRSLLLVPMQPAPFLDVGWSLEHEAIFYALVAACLAVGSLRALLPLLLALAGVGVVVHGVLPAVGGGSVWDLHLFSLYHVEFAVGVALYRLRARLEGLSPRALGLAGALLFAGVSQLVALHVAGPGTAGSIPIQPSGAAGMLRVAGYGLAGGLVLASLLAAERRGLPGAESPLCSAAVAGLRRLGDASYVLYLSHYFVYSILAKLYAALGVPASLAIPALTVALGAAVATAWGCHCALERPLLVWAHRRSSPRSRLAAA